MGNGVLAWFEWAGWSIQVANSSSNSFAQARQLKLQQETCRITQIGDRFA
jgi:hypothetical protein